MVAKLRVTLACGDYDRTKAIKEGVIQPEGVALNYIPIDRVAEIFWRMIRHEEFDVSEMSLASYIMMRSRGDERFIAIPVFTSRFFRHSCIYVNLGAGINRPEDLKGKRVGIPEYEMTAGVWVRGLLQHDYGVEPKELSWYTGGQEEIGREEKLSFSAPDNVQLCHVEDDTLSNMLDNGELDALITARMPSCFRKRPLRVGRLLANYREAEQDYFGRTGIFPIMHTVVIREHIYADNPWLAQSLFKAFEEAKDKVYAAQYDTSALYFTIPWLIPEMEETRTRMGEDFWPYGVEVNRHVLEELMVFLVEQGLLREAMSVDELFAPETLDSYRV